MSKKAIPFEWPEFPNDRARIKYYSKKYKESSIVEAFEDVYHIGLSDYVEDEMINIIPKELIKGDIIPLRINDIQKNNVVFDGGNYKTPIVSSVNLYKYKRFKTTIPDEPINVKIIDIKKDKIVVNPLESILDEWLIPIINNPNIQKVMGSPETIRVKNLRLTKGGFFGDAVIPSISDFVGEDYTIPAFIPGSQIVLNIADDFNEFVGKEVEAFVINYLSKPSTERSGSYDISLVCSVKEYLKFRGEKVLISMFNEWCDETDVWKEFSGTFYDGKITGVINSSKKCGVFVEISELNITGIVPVSPEDLVRFKPRTKIKVRIKGFDEEKFYNPHADQVQHIEPYVIRRGYLDKCNIKPILSLD